MGALADEISNVEPIEGLSLKHLTTFLCTYLHLPFEVRLVELTIPDKPINRLQKYRKVLK